MSNKQNKNEKVNLKPKDEDQNETLNEKPTSMKKKGNGIIKSVAFNILFVLIMFYFFNERFFRQMNSMYQTIDYLNSQIESISQTMYYQKEINNSLARNSLYQDNKLHSMNQKIDFFNEKIQKSIIRKINDISNEIKSFNKVINKFNDTDILLNQKVDNINKKVDLLDKSNESLNKKISSMNETLDYLNDTVNSMIQTTRSISRKNQNNEESLNKLIIASRSLNGPGILSELKKREKSPYDHFFIASQSSRYVYDIIDPFNTNKIFGTTNKNNNFFIDFSLKNPVTINGIKISSSFKRFPKSFDIEVNGKVVATVKDAFELNGENKDMIINFSPILASNVRFKQTGTNWDENNYYLYIKRIELLSPDSQYSQGVFETLIKNNEYHDPQKSGILITSTMFDTNSFHMLNSTNNIDTFNSNDQWFQIEMTQGKVILDGFRLKKYGKHKLKNFKIICTDDDKKTISNWTTLIEINEQKYGENKDLDIYEFDKSSQPVKYIRLIQTGPTWSNSNYLSFYHFDLFGKYY